MASHCDSLTCRGRRFGVGEGSAIPIITGMRKLATEPPLWFCDVEGKPIEATTEQLQNYMAFHRLCMIKLNRTYGMMKQQDWLQIVGNAMANVVITEVPHEATVAGTFLEFLEDYLTNRARAERREDLLSGRPWYDEEGSVDNGKGSGFYFIMRNFQAFLRREGVPKEMQEKPWLVARIKELEGEAYSMPIHHGSQRYTRGTWFVPAQRIEQQTPKLPLPATQLEVI